MNAAVSAHSDYGQGTRQRVLEYYVNHSSLSTPGHHAVLLDAVPADPAGIARTVQGLLIYEHVADHFYGCRIPEARRAESHIRPLEKIIDSVLALDRRSLAIPRPPEKRLVGICHHFMLLSLATFRHHGVPARGRGGFGAYFNPGKFEDHWVCEYWKADEARWALLDSQFDDVFVKNLDVRHNVHDVPRDQFLTASDAWRRCRAGELNSRNVRDRVFAASRPVVHRRQPNPRSVHPQQVRNPPMGCVGRAADARCRAFRRRTRFL